MYVWDERKKEFLKMDVLKVLFRDRFRDSGSEAVMPVEDYRKEEERA